MIILASSQKQKRNSARLIVPPPRFPLLHAHYFQRTSRKSTNLFNTQNCQLILNNNLTVIDTTFITTQEDKVFFQQDKVFSNLEKYSSNSYYIFVLNVIFFKSYIRIQIAFSYYIFHTYNISKISNINSYVINQMFKFQVFVILNYA